MKNHFRLLCVRLQSPLTKVNALAFIVISVLVCQNLMAKERAFVCPGDSPGFFNEVSNAPGFGDAWDYSQCYGASSVGLHPNAAPKTMHGSESPSRKAGGSSQISTQTLGPNVSAERAETQKHFGPDPHFYATVLPSVLLGVFIFVGFAVLVLYILNRLRPNRVWEGACRGCNEEIHINLENISEGFFCPACGEVGFRLQRSKGKPIVEMFDTKGLVS